MTRQERFVRLAKLLREFAQGLWNDELDAITLHLRHLGDARMPLPLPQEEGGGSSSENETQRGVEQHTGLPKGFEKESEHTSESFSLTQTQQAILVVLAAASDSLKGRTIAQRAGKRYGPHFRQVLADMVHESLLLHVRDGYWRSDRPHPGEQPPPPPSAG